MRDDLTIALEQATCRIIAHRFTLENERHRNMSRLKDKLAAAAAVAPRQAAKIEARADAIIASESELETMTDDAFAPHEALLDEARKGVQDLKHELATMSNSPPLEPSGGSPATAGATTPRVALGPHPDQPSKLEADAAAAGFDPHVYRAFEAGLPLEAAKAVNGS